MLTLWKTTLPFVTNGWSRSDLAFFWLCDLLRVLSPFYSLQSYKWVIINGKRWWTYSGTRKTGLSRTPWVTIGSLGTAGTARSTLTGGTLRGGGLKKKHSEWPDYRDDWVMFLILRENTPPLPRDRLQKFYWPAGDEKIKFWWNHLELNDKMASQN